jgi:type I restriction enzyme M protein
VRLLLDNHVTTKGLLQLELKEIVLSIIFCTFARKIELYSITSTLEMTNSINIKKLEAQLWESADLLRADSKLTSNQYCMPVLALIFLRYAYSRFKLVEKEVLKDRPVRNGRVLPVEASDFIEKSAIYLPEAARFDFLVNLPDDVVSSNIRTKDGRTISSIGEAVNNAMQLVEDSAEQLQGILPKNYNIFSDDLLR